MTTTRVPRPAAAAIAFGASIAGAVLIYLGLGDAQPLVTFGVLPTPHDVVHGRELLAVASAVTLTAGTVVAAAGSRLHGLLVASPGPAALGLTYVGPPSRGAGWVGLLLGVMAIVAALHAARPRRPGGSQ